MEESRINNNINIGCFLCFKYFIILSKSEAQNRSSAEQSGSSILVRRAEELRKDESIRIVKFR
jgi:hypothetical protein